MAAWCLIRAVLFGSALAAALAAALAGGVAAHAGGEPVQNARVRNAPEAAGARPPRAEARHPIAVSDIQPPEPAKLLFWTPDQQRFGYRFMERIFPGHVVKRGEAVRPLPRADAALTVRYTYNGEAWDVARFMEHNQVAGLLVLHDGRIVLERYGLGLTEEGRWTSFSMAKSITSTLVGAALNQGYIQSLDDPVTRYLPALKGSAYEGVTLRHLLTMTSGVRWNEDYTDPRSDVNRFAGLSQSAAGGGEGDAPSRTIAFMAQLPRAHEPGTTFNYNTAETGLAGEVVRAAVGKPLAQYLSETLWAPLGMEQDGFWVTDKPGADGREIAGCCFSASLRDYGRFGQFLLAGGPALLAEGWVGEATRPAVPTGRGGQGYGYLWWTIDGGGFEARGVFGQNIRILPEKKLVIVTLSAWPRPGDPERAEARRAFIEAVVRAVEEAGRSGS